MTGDATDCDADTACDGTTKVPNSEHTACGTILHICLFYCHYHIIIWNYSQNLLLGTSFILVCNAGYYKVGISCELCTGNKMKSITGDSADCETSCNGNTNIPNGAHTSCGKFIHAKILPDHLTYSHTAHLLQSCTICPGNRVKMEAGDAPSCDTECVAESIEPNAKHTECGNKKITFL